MLKTFFKSLAEMLKGEEINLDITEKDLETLHHSKLYKLARKYNPENRATIDKDYTLLKDYGDSPSARASFIGNHIRDYLKR